MAIETNKRTNRYEKRKRCSDEVEGMWPAPQKGRDIVYLPVVGSARSGLCGELDRQLSYERPENRVKYQ